MPRKIRCQSCEYEYQVGPNLAGKKVRCRQCQAIIPVPDEVDQPVDQSVELPPAEPRPEPSRSRRREEDDDSQPLSKRVNWKRQREPEEEPRPRRSGSFLWLFLLLGGLLLGVVCVGATVLVWRSVSPNPSRHLVARPAPAALDIQPTQLTQETRVLLNGHVDNLRVAGGGRYLILEMTGSRSLGVFDVNEAKLVRTIHHGLRSSRFAASMNDVVVAESIGQKLQRYDVVSGELKVEVDLPNLSIVGSTNLELGHASNGPLVVSNSRRHEENAGDSSTFFFDLETLQELPAPRNLEKQLQRAHHLVSPSGWYIASDQHLFALTDKGLQHRAEWKKPTAFVLVGASDKMVYPFGDSWHSLRDLPKQVAPGRTKNLHLPATQEGYYVQIEGGLVEPGDPHVVGSVNLMQHGRKEPLATFPSLPLDPLWNNEQAGLLDRSIARNIVWVPQAKLLVVMGKDRRHLMLYPVQPAEPPKPEVLAFTSQPPTTADRGMLFTYTPTVQASYPPVKYRVEGVNGATIAANGNLNWQVPLNHPGMFTIMRLIARDERGNETEQTLRLQFTARAAPLVICSEPTMTVRKGSTYTYAVLVQGGVHPVKYRVESQFPEVTVNDLGLISWQVPNNFAANEATLKLVVRDQAGTEAAQTITLKLSDSPYLWANPTQRGRSLATELPHRPVPVQPAITPPETNERQSITLPGVVTEVVRGGGGRYLVLHFRDLKQVGIFDLCQGKLTHTIDLPSQNVRLAAGMKVLAIYDVVERQVYKQDLDTGKRFPPGKLDPGPGEVESFCMGYGSSGPLLVSVKEQEPKFYSLENLQLIDTARDRPPPASSPLAPLKQALPGPYSPGRYGNSFVQGGPSGCSQLSLGFNVLTEYAFPNSVHHVTLGLEDQVLLMGGRGCLSPGFLSRHNPTFPQAPKPQQPDPADGARFLPANSGPYFFSVEPAGKGCEIHWYIRSCAESLGKFAPAELADLPLTAWKDLPLAQCFHLVPAAQRLAVLAPTGRTLHLFPVKYDDILKASGKEYAVFEVDSRVGILQPGDYTHPVRFLSNDSSYKWSPVLSGVASARIETEGRLMVTIPIRNIGRSTQVLLRATNSSGKTVDHPINFELPDK